MNTASVWRLVGVPALLCTAGLGLVWLTGLWALLLPLAGLALAVRTLHLVNEDRAPGLAQEPAMYAAVLCILMAVVTALLANVVAEGRAVDRAGQALCPRLEAQGVSCAEAEAARAALLAYLQDRGPQRTPDLAALQAQALAVEVLASEGTAAFGRTQVLGDAPVNPRTGTYALRLREPKLPPEAYFGELESAGTAGGVAHFSPRTLPLDLLFVWQEGGDLRAASGRYLREREPRRWLELAGGAR